MIPHSARKDCVRWIEEAVKNQARRRKACDVVEISIRTLQNWQKNGEVTEGVLKRAKKWLNQQVTVLKTPIKSGPGTSVICPQKSQDSSTICI